MSSTFYRRLSRPGRSAASERCCAPKAPLHERIISTARELIRRHGIRGVGVDAIAEAAGTNKMTLYRHFGSKDELLVACLNDVVREAHEAWAAIEAAHRDDPLAQLLGWIRMAAAACLSSDSRGCDLANAAVELADCDHPAKRVVEQFKTAQRDRLASLCRAAGATQPDLLADALSLLLEGARVSRQSVGREGPSARFVRLSEAVISSFGVSLAQPVDAAASAARADEAAPVAASRVPAAVRRKG